MAKYVYDVEDENFRRVGDKRGIPLNVNITEAHRIVNLLELGSSVESIFDKVKLSNPKASRSTIRSFIKNYDEGNIELPTDAPVPVKIFDEMTNESNYDELAIRVKNLEDKVSEIKSECFTGAFAGEPKKKSIIEKVKSWV